MFMKTQSLFAYLVTAAVSLSLATHSSYAQDPNLQVRIFAERTANYAECTDFTAEDSAAILLDDVLFKNKSTATIVFGESDGSNYTFPFDYQLRDADGNVLLELAGTRWERGTIQHVTTGGVVEIRDIYWLVENASKPVTKIGSLSGPDGDVVPIGSGYIQYDTSLYNTYRITSVPNGSSAGHFCVSMGLFQR